MQFAVSFCVYRCVLNINTTLSSDLTICDGSHSVGAAVLFLDLWNRSLCHLMEQLVEVSQEHPATGMGYIYHPACVPLWRCAGCCSDENLECHPLVTQNTTMQVWSPPMYFVIIVFMGIIF
jgi:hypothetical protein